MIRDEAIFLGTPRQFATAAEIYGWQLYGQGIERQLGTRYGVDEDLTMGGQWTPSETREPVLAFVDLRNLGHIMVQQIGNNRTRLACFCERDDAWTFAKEWWTDLVAELTRLGSIESDPQEHIEGSATEIQRRIELDTITKPTGGKRRTRGTSAATDAKALEAYRLYYEELLTQAEIAEHKAVTVKTVQRWLERARKLKATK